MWWYLFCLGCRNRGAGFCMQVRDIREYQEVEILFAELWNKIFIPGAALTLIEHKMFPMMEVVSDSVLTWKQVQSHPASARSSPPPCRSDPSRSNPFQRSASSAISEVTRGQKESTAFLPLHHYFLWISFLSAKKHNHNWSPVPPCRWWSTMKRTLIHRFSSRHQNCAGLWRKSSTCLCGLPTQKGIL